MFRFSAKKRTVNREFRFVFLSTDVNVACIIKFLSTISKIYFTSNAINIRFYENIANIKNITYVRLLVFRKQLRRDNDYVMFFWINEA